MRFEYNKKGNILAYIMTMFPQNQLILFIWKLHCFLELFHNFVIKSSLLSPIFQNRENCEPHNIWTKYHGITQFRGGYVWKKDTPHNIWTVCMDREWCTTTSCIAYAKLFWKPTRSFKQYIAERWKDREEIANATGDG